MYRLIPRLVFALLLVGMAPRSASADLRFEDLEGLLVAEVRLPQDRLPGTSPLDPRLTRLLSGLRGPDGRPLESATPLYLEALKRLEGMPASTAALVRARLVPPPLAGEKRWMSPDGAFLVRYTDASNSPDAIPAADSDGNGVPDLLPGLARTAATAREVLVDRLGWPDPVVTPPFEVVLARLPGPSAYLVPGRSLGDGAGVGSIMVLDPGVLENPSRALSVVARQLAHASQWSVTTRTESWWYEATAAWAALETSGDLSPLLPWLRDRARHRERGLRSETLWGAIGSSQFALYLSERGGEEMIGQIWAALAESETGLVDVLDERLRALDGRGLDEHVRLYHLWNLAVGPADTGRHYHLGALLPGPEVEPVLRRLPESGTERERAPRGLAANYVGVRTTGLEGGVQITFTGEEGIHWALDAVGVRPGGGFEHIPVELAGDARGALTMPASRYDRILLVVHNLEFDPEVTGAYSYSVETAGDYPYRLEGLNAMAGPGQVLLTWSTISEQDLWGWRVLRSFTPEGPWDPAGPVMVPAVGYAAGGGAQGYSFLDTTAVGGVRYFYRLEGVTIHGVPVQSGMVSAAVPPLITEPSLLQTATPLDGS